MTAFVGSANSRYYAGVRGRRLFLAKEDLILWEKELPFEVFQLISVSNYGQLFVRAPEGIYVYEVDGEDPGGPVRRWSREELAQTSSQLGDVKASADGRELCVERMTTKTRLSEKIFEFLSSTTVEPNTSLHEIIFHDLTEDTTKFFYRGMSSVKNPQKFLYDISPDFEWIIMAEPQKNDHMKFSVAHVPSKTLYHDFAIPHLRIRALRVGRDGTSLVDVSQGDHRGMVVVTADGARTTLTSPTDYRICHLGRTFVALKTAPTPLLMIKGFDDQLKSHADLRPLDRLNLEYDVSFNEQDNIDLMSCQEGTFKVVHSSLEFLEIDARRWERVADLHDEDENAPLVEDSRGPRRFPDRLELDTPVGRGPAPQPTPPVAPSPALRPYLPPLSIERRGGASKAETPTPPVKRPYLELGTNGGLSGTESPPRLAAPPSASARLAPPAPSPPSVAPPPPVSPRAADEAERRRLERLMELLEERFILGQVTEPTYLELRDKYRRRLGF